MDKNKEKLNGELTMEELDNVAGGTQGTTGKVCMLCKSCMQQFWGTSREDARNALFHHMDVTRHERIKKARF